MIRRLQIRNFKSIKHDMSMIEFAPITLFAGANSSGKSSVIQSILLMMQTFAARQNATLLLNGELVTLGTIVDVWNSSVLTFDKNTHGKFEVEPLHFRLDIDDPKNNRQEFALDLTFMPMQGIHVRLTNAEYHFIHYDDDHTVDDYFTIAYKKDAYIITEITSELEEHMVAELSELGLHDIETFKNAKVEMDGLFPRSFDIKAKVPTPELNLDLALIKPNDDRIDAHDLKYPISNHYKNKLKKVVKQQNLPAKHREAVQNMKTFGDYRAWYSRLSVRHANQLTNALQHELDQLLVRDEITQNIPFMGDFVYGFLHLTLENIRYLGAYRIGPTIIFSPDVTSEWSEVGMNGANVAAALKEHGTRSIDWYDPIDFKEHTTTLFEALEKWLKFFGLLDEVATQEEGKLGTMLKIRSAGVNRDMDLTSVGFGTSQLLPIIVQGLLTKPWGLFIVEQPEVHLHPHVQSQLAIFFIALAKANVQCVIETHSENIVNQLRLFIARGNRAIREQIKIYFADRDIEDGTAFQEVELDDAGNISNWPAGFMDESKHQAQQMLEALLAEED